MKFLLFIFLWAISISISFCQPISLRTGGGNINNGLYNAANIEYISILESSGAKVVRVNLFPNDYWNFNTNAPKNDYADSLLLYLAAKKINVILLFEHYSQFVSLGQPLGNYSKWYQIGAAFANRYQVGSTFFLSNGINDYGIKYYTAINEPDLGGYMPKTILDGPENYHDAIEGLADGVHSIGGNLKVIPGGFAKENSAGDHTLNGFGLAIADLFNNGKLYGIDLHTYNDLNYAPIVKYDNTNYKEFMAFYDFKEVKNGCGITADIKFCSTEFGFKENTQGINDTLAAKRLLTCIWGNLGAVLNDSTSSATEYALVWNMYNTIQDDAVYGMCISRTPYSPSLKGRTFNLVVDLAKNLDFTHLDPFVKGEYTLIGLDKKMWVFQNYNKLSTIYGSTYTINQIPINTASIKVYNWSGLLYTIPYTNFSSYTFNNLNINETYMFVAESNSISNISILSSESGCLAYPNPFENEVMLKLPHGLKNISIYNILGHQIESVETTSTTLSIGDKYSPGVYFVSIHEGNTNKTIKLIKQ